MQVLWVAAGGAIGSTLRYWLSSWVNQAWGDRFPWGTLVVNCIGSLLFGLLVVSMGRFAESQQWVTGETVRLFGLVGCLGAFTTFSTFSYETLQLIDTQRWAMAMANVLANVISCVIGVWLGTQVVRVV